MKDEALRLALEALEYNDHLRGEAITAIKQALEQPEHSCIACEGNPKGKNNPCNVCGLAQPEPEPVAWLNDCEEIHFDKEDAFRYSNGFIQPLYTSPPKREWQGLTDDEIRQICDENFIMLGDYAVDFIESIQAKLKEKNT